MTRLTSISLIVFVFLIFAFTAPAVLANASIEVNTTVDENNTGSDCSLREAITAANTDTDFGGCVGSGDYGTDTITFSATVFGTTQTITLTSALPDITTNLTISGPGANLLRISGNSLYRPFTLSNPISVTISNLTIANGYTTGNGGGILSNADSMVLLGVAINDNKAQEGGGVWHTGSLLAIMDSFFSGNEASSNGGALYDGSNQMSLSNSTMFDNTAFAGGGVYIATGIAFLVNSTLSANSANQFGGGVYNAGGQYGLSNMLIADSVGTNCFSLDGGDATNISTDASCTGFTVVSSASLKLDTPADNGGPTPTIALLAGSTAIDTGNNGIPSEAGLGADFNGDGDLADSLLNDQRGTGSSRLRGSSVDAGAFEYSVISPPNAAPKLNYSVTDIVTLTWNPITGATGYEVQISDSNRFTTLLCGGIINLGSDILSVDTCSIASGTYYWRVHAITDTAISAWSTPVSFVIYLFP